MFPVVVIRQPGQTPIHVQVREAIEVGRECTGVILVDPKVSRRHLVLAPTHDGGADEVAVLDLGSLNGTLLRGARIDTEVVLRAGDEIRLGETTIAVVPDPTGLPRRRRPAPAAGAGPAASTDDAADGEPDDAADAVAPDPDHVGSDAHGADDAVDEIELDEADLATTVLPAAGSDRPNLRTFDESYPIDPVDRTGPDRTPDVSVWQRPADGTPGSAGEPADPWL